MPMFLCAYVVQKQMHQDSKVKVATTHKPIYPRPSFVR